MPSCWDAGPFAAALTLTYIHAMPCQSALAALLLQGSPKPSVIPEGSWDVGTLSYILQEPKVGQLVFTSAPVCRFSSLLTLSPPGECVRYCCAALNACAGLSWPLLALWVRDPADACCVRFVVAVPSLPPMLQGKAKERHELFSQGQRLSEIALVTAQVAGKPPTVRNTLHVLL